MDFRFSTKTSVCLQAGRFPPPPQQGLTVHVGRPEGPNGGGPLPARGQHLHLQAVEGGGPQTRDRELGVILGKGREGVGEHGPSGAASDHDPRRDSPPETTPLMTSPCYTRFARLDSTVFGGPVVCPHSPETIPPPRCSGQQGDPDSWQPRAQMSQASSWRSPPPPPGDDFPFLEPKTFPGFKSFHLHIL